MSTNISATAGWAGGKGVGIATRGSLFLLTESWCRQQESGKCTEEQQIEVEEEEERKGAWNLLLQDGESDSGKKG